jgi:hypothetical protein
MQSQTPEQSSPDERCPNLSCGGPRHAPQPIGRTPIYCSHPFHGEQSSPEGERGETLEANCIRCGASIPELPRLLTEVTQVRDRLARAEAVLREIEAMPSVDPQAQLPTTLAAAKAKARTYFQSTPEEETRTSSTPKAHDE